MPWAGFCDLINFMRMLRVSCCFSFSEPELSRLLENIVAIDYILNRIYYSNNTALARFKRVAAYCQYQNQPKHEYKRHQNTT